MSNRNKVILQMLEMLEYQNVFTEMEVELCSDTLKKYWHTQEVAQGERICVKPGDILYVKGGVTCTYVRSEFSGDDLWANSWDEIKKVEVYLQFYNSGNERRYAEIQISDITIQEKGFGSMQNTYEVDKKCTCLYTPFMHLSNFASQGIYLEDEAYFDAKLLYRDEEQGWEELYDGKYVRIYLK